MATLYVTEFNVIGGTSNHNIASGFYPAVAEQTVAIGGGSLQSAAFNKNTNFVRLNTDSACSISFGTNPTASTVTARLAANQTEYFSIPSGQSYKIAVIANT